MKSTGFYVRFHFPQRLLFTDLVYSSHKMRDTLHVRTYSAWIMFFVYNRIKTPIISKLDGWKSFSMRVWNIHQLHALTTTFTYLTGTGLHSHSHPRLQYSSNVGNLLLPHERPLCSRSTALSKNIPPMCNNYNANALKCCRRLLYFGFGFWDSWFFHFTFLDLIT
jgi:hypothetical protein